MAPLRLRVPAALAVAVLGVSAPLAMSFGGCHEDPIPPEPTDAGLETGKMIDARVDDAAVDAPTPPLVDAGVIDAAEVVVDAPPPDAADPPPH